MKIKHTKSFTSHRSHLKNGNFQSISFLYFNLINSSIDILNINYQNSSYKNISNFLTIIAFKKESLILSFFEVKDLIQRNQLTLAII